MKKYKSLETSKEIISAKESATALINRYLKIVGAWVGEDSLTTHISRHSFSAISYSKTKDVRAIQKMLNHSKLDTTENYLAELNDTEMDNISDDIYKD